MVNKVFESVDEAVAGIPDGVMIALHAWGGSGTPAYLIDAVRRLGIKDIALVSPTFIPLPIFEGELPGPVSLLPQLKKVITAGVGTRPFQSLDADFLADRVKNGELEIEMSTHAILAERLHAGAMGLGGFYDPVGVGTIIEKGKEKRVIDGVEYIFQTPLRPDVALAHAYRADTLGNLVFRGTARGTSPLHLMAAKLAIVEAEEIVAPGELDPDSIHTPGIFVDRLVKIPAGGMASREHAMSIWQRIAENALLKSIVFGAKKEDQQ